MASELRWILAGLSLLLLVGIWWWGARRSRQAPGNAELRESSVVASTAEAATHEPESRVWPASSRSVAPFAPLSIHTAEFESVEHQPMSAHGGPGGEADGETWVISAEAEPSEAAGSISLAVDIDLQDADLSMRSPPSPAPGWDDPSPTSPGLQTPNVSEQQRIVTIRVGAVGDQLWVGSALLAALEQHGLAYGRYQVFHRKHSDGRTLFCAASMVEPGTFDPVKMPHELYRGLTLFAVLPGPIEPLQTLDALLETAAALAASLHGTVQDSKGMDLVPERAAELREDVARFQSALSMT